MQPLVNRVAQSGLITIKLEEFFPKADTIAHFDLKDYLFMEMILKEKDFRAAMKAHDWVQYESKHLIVFCSVDAIIPMWAYMLIAVYAEPYATSIFQGTASEFLKVHYERQIENLDISSYIDQRLVIKGCSDQPVPASAYASLTRRLRPIAKSIMFGEPCSTVPIYKAKKMNQ
ncbi:MAG: DUF2480 family protein [Bacteroidota bacterium]